MSTGSGPPGAAGQDGGAFHAVVQASPFGMHLYRLEADGRLVFTGANPAADRILGVDNAQFVGKTIEEAFPPLVGTEVPARYRAAAGQGLPWRTEQVAYQDDRILGAFEVTAFRIAPGEMAAVFQDITERKRAEVALAQEKERLSVTLRSIGDGVISTDVAGHITLMNRVAERLTGWTSAEAVGRPAGEVLRLVDQASRRPVADPVQRVLATGRTVELPARTLLLARDGTERSVGDSGAPIRDDQSRVVGVVLVFRDTTERERLDDAERRNQRLESLGLLAGGIAHDFNNLLSGLFGYVDLARTACDEPESVRDYMTSAASVLSRAKGLTHQLLTFARGGTPVRRAVDLSLLVRETARFALTGASIQASFDLASDLAPVHADAGQLGQAIDNLLINAKQAMPAGGRILVGAANLAPGAPRPPGLVPGRRYVVVTVQDHGTGIPPEHLPRIFDPFFTTKQSGSGLGLASVHSILTKHDGAIEVASELGRGTTFSLYLPAHQAPAQAPGPASAVARFGGRTVLVLDDEDYIRDVAGAMLRRMGCEVVLVRDGAEVAVAARLARAEGRPLDAVILDLTIPGGLGGRQALDELRLAEPDLPAIASSGYSEDPIIAAPAEFGFRASLRKPYVLDELRAALAKVLGAAG